VQLEAVEPLLTVRARLKLVAVIPAASVAWAVSVCAPLERELVLRVKDQVLVPEAGE